MQAPADDSSSEESSVGTISSPSPRRNSPSRKKRAFPVDDSSSEESSHKPSPTTRATTKLFMTPMPSFPLANATSPEGSRAPPPHLPRTSSAKKRQGEVLPQTTSRQRKDKVPVIKIKKGCRVKIIRHDVYHIDSAGQRKKIPDDVGNSYIIYGTVVAGSSGRRGWDVQFDIFPLENHTINNIDRKKLITVPSDEEEKEYDRPFENQSLPSTFDEPVEKRTGKANTP
jgi:hypothetical protein